MKRGTIFASLLALLTIAGSAAARLGNPAPVTERGRIIDDLYFQITVAGIIVFVFVMVLLAFILIRFREGGKGRATYEHERDNLKAEALWTIIPLMIMLWIGVISYQGLVELDNMDGSFDSSDAVIIDITGQQYAWQANYADTGVSVLAVANEDLAKIKPFVVPADTPLVFRITAVPEDVLHGFFVQMLGINQMAVPGVINEVIVADGAPEGEYFTQCNSICLTPGHSYMHAKIVAVSQAEYEAWTEETLAGAAAGLEQVMPLQWANGAFSPLKGSQAAVGATLHLEILNDDDAPIDVTFAGQTISVPSKGLNTITTTVSEAGPMVVNGPGADFTVDAVNPETVDIDLGAFVLEPSQMSLDAGKLYVINVANVHTVAHNLYIGMNGADGNTEAIWATGDLVGGASQSILVTPTEAATLDMWCAVAGHYDAGMYGSVTVV